MWGNLGNWKPFKMMKNAIYFILQACFVLKIFVLTVWSSKEATWLEKIRLTSKCMMSQTVKQTMAIHNIAQFLKT